MQLQDRRISQIPQSNNSETIRNQSRMGRFSLESNSSIQLFPDRVIRSSTILPFMFRREAAVKHTLLESENPKYLGTDDGIINVGLMTKLYHVVAHNLNEARKARDGKKKSTKPREPVVLHVGDNVLVRDHTSKAFQPKYKDFCIVGLIGKNQIEIKDNHGHITKVHRKDVKKIPMTEKVCQLYEEEQLEKTREGRKAVPTSKMPELGWDITEALEIKENKHNANNIPLGLQTIVTIIIIVSIVIRLGTTQLRKLATFLKEAAITTLKTSHNIYRQNMEKLHITTTAAITITTSMTNWIDHDEMNPNNDTNSHSSVNSRKPSD